MDRSKNQLEQQKSLCSLFFVGYFHGQVIEGESERF